MNNFDIIFKTYDVRGIVPNEFDIEYAYKIGRAYPEMLKAKKILVGSDCRLTSPKIKKAFVSGMLDSGCDVLDLGEIPTPVLYYSIYELDVLAGATITASHNPKEYNGIKFWWQDKIGLEFNQGLEKLKKFSQKNLSKKSTGKLTKINIWPKYFDFLNSQLKKINLKPLKIVVDAGNGMGGISIYEFFSKIPELKIIGLNLKPDGNFPAHLPHPLEEQNIKELQQKIIENKADLGIATDGDGDRVVFLDEKGKDYRGEQIGALITTNLLEKNPRSKILYDVRSSKSAKEIIESAGGKLILSKIGHTKMKEKMISENILFGAEMSSHFYFKDSYYTDNADLAIIQILDILSKNNKTLSKILEPIVKKYYTMREEKFKVENQEETITEIENYFKAQGAKIDKFEGLSVEMPNFWFNIRPSGTEPVIKLNIEAKNKNSALEAEGKIKQIILGL